MPSPASTPRSSVVTVTGFHRLSEKAQGLSLTKTECPCCWNYRKPFVQSLAVIPHGTDGTCRKSSNKSRSMCGSFAANSAPLSCSTTQLATRAGEFDQESSAAPLTDPYLRTANINEATPAENRTLGKQQTGMGLGPTMQCQLAAR